MKFTTPTPLSQKHEPLHFELRRTTQASGAGRETAKTLAGLLHLRCVTEDQIALPLMGALSRAEFGAKMNGVLALTDWLEAERLEMLEQHKATVIALQRQQVAARAGRIGAATFARQMLQPARTEEEKMYPAAAAGGRRVRRLLVRQVAQRVSA